MFLNQIQQRRSVRKFKPQPVEKKKVDQLIEAALRSPSSRSFNPWQFIVVDRPELLEKLAGAKPHGASFLKNAPLGIVVLGDTSASDVWVEDTSIASIFIHLAAQSLDLGSCWIQIRKREHNDTIDANTYIRELLNVPEHLSVESILAIGYPDESKSGHSRESLDFEKVSFNSYGSAD